MKLDAWQIGIFIVYLKLSFERRFDYFIYPLHQGAKESVGKEQGILLSVFLLCATKRINDSMLGFSYQPTKEMIRDYLSKLLQREFYSDYMAMLSLS